MLLALDIGGTFIKWAVADGYELRRQGKIRTPKDTLSSLIASIQGILLENSENTMNLFSCQLFSLQMLYDPERFLIGGEISANERYIRTLREKYEELYNLYQLHIPRADILPCKFRNTSNLIGALVLYYDQYPV